MHPSAPGYLSDLRELAGQLFDVICEEFTAGAPVTVRFERVDDLVDKHIGERHLVTAALLCAQLLHRVTAEPAQAQPRHVQTLADIIDQVIPRLVDARPAESATAVRLLDIGGGIAQAAFSLVLLADPDGVGYEAG